MGLIKTLALSAAMAGSLGGKEVPKSVAALKAIKENVAASLPNEATTVNSVIDRWISGLVTEGASQQEIDYLLKTGFPALGAKSSVLKPLVDNLTQTVQDESENNSQGTPSDSPIGSGGTDTISQDIGSDKDTGTVAAKPMKIMTPKEKKEAVETLSSANKFFNDKDSWKVGSGSNSLFDVKEVKGTKTFTFKSGKTPLKPDELGSTRIVAGFGAGKLQLSPGKYIITIEPPIDKDGKPQTGIDSSAQLEAFLFDANWGKLKQDGSEVEAGTPAGTKLTIGGSNSITLPDKFSIIELSTILDEKNRKSLAFGKIMISEEESAEALAAGKADQKVENMQPAVTRPILGSKEEKEAKKMEELKIALANALSKRGSDSNNWKPGTQGKGTTKSRNDRGGILLKYDNGKLKGDDALTAEGFACLTAGKLTPGKYQISFKGGPTGPVCVWLFNGVGSVLEDGSAANNGTARIAKTGPDFELVIPAGCTGIDFGFITSELNPEVRFDAMHVTPTDLVYGTDVVASNKK